MTTLTNSFEGGTSGTTISTGNSGGTSGDAFDTVSIGANATLAFDSTHAASGSLSCKAATGITSATVYASWNASLGSGLSQVWFRQYLYLTANPGAAIVPFIAFSAPAGAVCASVQLNTGGTLSFKDDGGTVIFTTTAAIPLNQWFRIEGFIIGSSSVGQVELKLFKTANSTTPDETDTSTALQNTRGTMGDWRFGENTNRANVTAYWMDDLGISTDGYIGPVPASSAGLLIASYV